jgi:SAM-dependent methyltransferase
MFVESDAYERFMGRWSRRLAPLLIDFAEVGVGQAVLDVGSGTGALAFAAAAVPATRVTGVDPAQRYIEYAQERADGANVRFELADAQALPFSDATFDRALALLSLNFVPDPGRALDEMTRATRPGGVVAAAVWDYGDSMEMLRAFWDEAVTLDPDAPDEGRMPLSRCGELAALWRVHRLESVEETLLVIETTFTSFDDYWRGFLGGQGPAGAYIATLTESQRAALRSRLHDRLAPSGGGFTLRACAWGARGVVMR